MSRQHPVPDPATTFGTHLTESEARLLPRMQVGYPPQHLLLTLLGDYGLDRVRQSVPSASLVAMLGDFGVTTAGARAAIARLARRGLLRSSRSGRHTGYTVTRRCAELVGDARLLTYSFTGTMTAWDGRWTLVAYTIGEDQRAQRALLRARLRWLGFAPLQDGLWISPHPPSSALDDALKEVMAGSCSVFTADALEGPDRTDPLSAWKVEEVRRAFDAFVEEFEPAASRLARDRVGAREALEVRTRLTYRWFNLANEHAELPLGLLPPDWPAGPARNLFTLLIDGLAPLAAQRIAQHVASCDVDLAARVRPLTVADVLGPGASGPDQVEPDSAGPDAAAPDAGAPRRSRPPGRRSG